MQYIDKLTLDRFAGYIDDGVMCIVGDHFEAHPDVQAEIGPFPPSPPCPEMVELVAVYRATRLN